MYPSKHRDYRVIDNAKHGTKRLHSRSEGRPREEGSTMTILRYVATITITLAQLVYQVVTRGGMVLYT